MGNQHVPAWPRRLLGAVALACGILGPPVTIAEEAPIGFAEAARRSLAQHPQWRSLALELGAADARRALAALRPPLELAVDLEGFAGSGAYRAVDGAELSVRLTSLFERGGKLPARVAVADAERDLLTVEQRAAALDLLAETGRRFVALAVAQERRRLAELAQGQAASSLESVRARVSRARSPRTELLDAEIRHAQASNAYASAGRDLELAQMSLAAQWNDESARPTVSLPLLDTAPVPALEQLEPRLRSVPDLERYASATRVQEAQLRLTRAEAVADWRWSLGIRRFEVDHSQALIAGVAVPLNAAKRTEASAKLAELRGRQAMFDSASRLLALKATLGAQLCLLQNLRARIQSITEIELPRMQEMLQLIERGYAIGRFAYRELATVRAQWLDLELSRLEAAAEYHRGRIEIDRLTGAQQDLLAESQR